MPTELHMSTTKAKSNPRIRYTVYGFTAAFFGGILLGLIYIQSGIESAIAAHFCANFLFFSASYLS